MRTTSKPLKDKLSVIVGHSIPQLGPSVIVMLNGQNRAVMGSILYRLEKSWLPLLGKSQLQCYIPDITEAYEAYPVGEELLKALGTFCKQQGCNFEIHSSDGKRLEECLGLLTSICRVPITSPRHYTVDERSNYGPFNISIPNDELTYWHNPNVMDSKKIIVSSDKRYPISRFYHTNLSLSGENIENEGKAEVDQKPVVSKQSAVVVQPSLFPQPLASMPLGSSSSSEAIELKSLRTR